MAQRARDVAIAKELGRPNEIDVFRTQIKYARNDINSGRLKLNKLVEDMLQKKITEVTGPEIVALETAIEDMEEAINFYRGNFKQGPRLKVLT